MSHSPRIGCILLLLVLAEPGPASAQEASAPHARCAADSLAGPATAPVPLRLIMPPVPAPAAAVGRTYQVTIRVRADGTAVPDSTRFDPELEPPAYRRRFTDALRQVRFEPARIGECAVPGEYTMQVTLR